MKTLSASYYTKQLNKLQTNSDYPPVIQVISGEDKTKFMSINKESAQDLINWLRVNFLEK